MRSLIYGKSTIVHRYSKGLFSAGVLLAIGLISIFPFYTVSADDYTAYESKVEQPCAGFEQYIKSIYESIGLEKKGLDFKVFRYAIIGYYNLKKENTVMKKTIISIVDYCKSCNDARLYIIDLIEEKLLFHSLVAHGKFTGDIYAKHFSNEPGSLKSSLGFFVTGDTFSGEHGYSLYLEGMEEGFNDNARSRAIIIHGAYYVSRPFIKEYGKIGRSHGCPALPAGLHIRIIDTIKGGSCLFQFYDDENYIKKSAYLDVMGACSQFEKENQGLY